MDSISLNIFSSRLSSVCDEMGATLQRAALSSNIKDRLDYSCAIFDVEGNLCAQAAHIPVHLGSMTYAMKDIVACIRWQEHSMVVLNDPYLGGTHLPDVTMIAPVFVSEVLIGFVVNRAHHADIGATSSGSMPLSCSLEEEGVIISPTVLIENGEIKEKILGTFLGRLNNKEQGRGDFLAQISANSIGVSRLCDLVEAMTFESFYQGVEALQNYGESLALALLGSLPEGEYDFEDVLDSDGFRRQAIPLRITVQINKTSLFVDFKGTSSQVPGNLNCPLSVAAAAVFYVFRCLLPTYAPACTGIFKPITLRAPDRSLVNPERPAAVAAGNVETSMRIVDVLIGVLTKAIPDKMAAAGTGSMNNVAMGGPHWDYYETIGGGMGGNPLHPGISGVQNHMTNTLNTPVESLEMHYPLRIRRYALRAHSGGAGKHLGGEGLRRDYEFLESTEVTLLTERRTHAPWGMAGGTAATVGKNRLNGKRMPAKCRFQARVGDILSVETAGGGGWGIG